jgi:hypothetical protein
MHDSPRPRAGVPPASPKIVGRFHCEERLGGDGLLESWRARVSGLAGFDRVFALKCLAPGALARRPNAAESLLRAARASAALKDARLAAVADSGLAPGSAFVATEFVHGAALGALRETALGTGQGGAHPPHWYAMVAHIASEVAAGLAVAHGSTTSLAHGALAPANVMVTPQGAVKLMDLGLRAAVHTPAELAASPGRRPYLAPELAAGGKPTAAADMFALGVLARELATGRAAATGPGPAGPRLAALAPALAEAVGALVDPDPGERPSAARAAELFAAAAEATGVDLRGELGALARRAMQARPHEEPAPADESVDAGPLDGRPDDSGAMPIAAQPSSDFIEEPTKVLSVAADGSPEELASLLKDLRSRGVEPGAFNLPTGGGPASSANNIPTPARGIEVPEAAKAAPRPAVTKPTLQYGAPAVSARAGEAPAEPPAAAKAETSARPEANAPAAPLSNVTTAEIGANLPADLPSPMAEIPVAVLNDPEHSGEVVQEPTEVMRFQDFAADIREAGPARPTGEGPADAPPPDERDSAALHPVQIAATPGPKRRFVVAGMVGVLAIGGALLFLLGRADHVSAPTASVKGAAQATKAAPPPLPPPKPAETPPSAPTPPPKPAAELPAPAPTTTLTASSSTSTTAAPPSEIEVHTSPEGATIWLDGKNLGMTPKTLKLPPEAREMRLVRPGFQMKVLGLGAAIGSKVAEELAPTAAPPWGESVLKVECHTRDRFPVLVDGQEIGLLCPTGKLGMVPGMHEVAIFDPATGDKHAQMVEVTGSNYRVRFVQ